MIAKFVNESLRNKKRVIPYPNKQNLGYLFGDFKINKISDITQVDEKDGTYEYVTVLIGRKNEEVDLWREEGTDEWYDENSNATGSLHRPKRKIINNLPYYD